MEIKDKSISGIREFFRNELKPVWGEIETEGLFFICMNEMKGWGRSALNQNLDDNLSENEINKFKSVISRLKKQEPVQYIFGRVPFAGCEIKVNPAVLIPRPETEEMVYLAKELFSSNPPENILDLCTGSGCIALGLKNKFPQSVVTGYDISEEAIKVACLNAELNHLAVDFFQMDILHEFPDKRQKFDLIISNPPYIPVSEKKRMQKNVVEFEPEIALFTKENNALIFYERIASAWSLLLNKGSFLLMEINESKADEVKKILDDSHLFSFTEIKKDLQNKNRFALAVKN